MEKILNTSVESREFLQVSALYLGLEAVDSMSSGDTAAGAPEVGVGTARSHGLSRRDVHGSTGRAIDLAKPCFRHSCRYVASRRINPIF